MSSVQDYFLQALRPYVPEGAEIISAVSKTATSTEITVRLNNLLQTATMEKVEINNYLGQRTPEVLVQEGESLSDAIERFSKKYRLFLVAGTDYKAEATEVRFEELTAIYHDLTLLPSSLGLYGVVSVRLVKQVEPSTFTEVVVDDFFHQRQLLALSSRIFSVNEDPQLSFPEELAEEIVQYLTEVDLLGTVNVAQLTSADVGGVLYDGVSNLVLLKDEQGVIWPIRYNLPV